MFLRKVGIVLIILTYWNEKDARFMLLESSVTSETFSPKLVSISSAIGTDLDALTGSLVSADGFLVSSLDVLDAGTEVTTELHQEDKTPLADVKAPPTAFPAFPTAALIFLLSVVFRPFRRLK